MSDQTEQAEGGAPRRHVGNTVRGIGILLAMSGLFALALYAIRERAMGTPGHEVKPAMAETHEVSGPATVPALKRVMLSTGGVSATFPQLLKDITPDTLIFPTYKMIVVDTLPTSDPNRQPILDFMKLYEEKQGKKADFYAGAGWDLAHIAIEALKKAGSDPKKIRDEIQRVKDYPATMAVLTFAPDNHRGAGPSAQVMGQFKDGKFMAAK